MNSPSQEALRGPVSASSEKGAPLWKRVLDVCLVLATAPAWLPLGLVISAIIKIVSPGPIFFKQERVGYLGRRFLCLKFRTMFVNADTGVHEGHLADLMASNRPMVKLDSAGDQRLIPGGLILRSLGLDELPQLINVLSGDMSLAGPRPCLPYEYERYLPRHRQRCETLPGLTGLWQTNGKNKTTFEEMIDLDVHYAKNKSLLLDMKIIVQTIPAMVTQALEVRRAKQRNLKKHLATETQAVHSESHRA